MKPEDAEFPDDALIYARLLELAGRAGLSLLALAFVAYMAGWLAPEVPVQQLPELWSLPVADFLRESGMASGWGWLAQAMHGDVAGLLGIVLLVGASLPALLMLGALYGRRGDRVYAALCLLQFGVLLLAASGALS